MFVVCILFSLHRTWGEKTSELLELYCSWFSERDPSFPFDRRTSRLKTTTFSNFNASVRLSTIDNRSLAGTYAEEDITPECHLSYGGFIVSEEEMRLLRHGLHTGIRVDSLTSLLHDHKWVPDKYRKLKFWVRSFTKSITFMCDFALIQMLRVCMS